MIGSAGLGCRAGTRRKFDAPAADRSVHAADLEADLSPVGEKEDNLSADQREPVTAFQGDPAYDPRPARDPGRSGHRHLMTDIQPDPQAISASTERAAVVRAAYFTLSDELLEQHGDDPSGHDILLPWPRGPARKGSASGPEAPVADPS